MERSSIVAKIEIICEIAVFERNVNLAAVTEAGEVFFFSSFSIALMYELITSEIYGTVAEIRSKICFRSSSAMLWRWKHRSAKETVNNTILS